MTPHARGAPPARYVCQDIARALRRPACTAAAGPYPARWSASGSRARSSCAALALVLVGVVRGAGGRARAGGRSIGVLLRRRPRSGVAVASVCLAAPAPHDSLSLQAPQAWQASRPRSCPCAACTRHKNQPRRGGSFASAYGGGGKLTCQPVARCTRRGRPRRRPRA